MKKRIVGMLLLAMIATLTFLSCKDDVKESEHIHTRVIDPEVVPVCGQDGLTKGEHCSECGEILIRQKPIPARAEKCSPAWKVEMPATKTEDGYKVYECMICGKNHGSAVISAGSQNLNYEQNSDGTYYVKSISYGGDMDIVIPETHNGKPITGIGNQAIVNGTVSLALNSSITQIDETAFDECQTLIRITVPAENPSFCSVDGNLYSKDGRVLIKYASAQPATTFALPDGVCAVRANAFRHARSLETIDFPTGLQSVGKEAFYGCAALKSVIFPEGVIHVGQGAFYNCWSLKSVVFPDSVTELGTFMFEYCRALESVTLPLGLREIPDGLFFLSGPLRSVNIPEGITRIGEKSFSGCYALQEVSLPEGLLDIGDSAFWECEALQSIRIPASVTHIGNWAFEKCIRLEAFDVAADNAVYESVDGNLYDKKDKVLIYYAGGKKDEIFRLPDGVTGIKENALMYAPHVKRVEIPDSVTWIGQSAFGYCDTLQSVVIGAGVTEIPKEAFFNCGALESVTLSENVTQIGEYAFNWCSKLAEIHFGGTMQQWEGVEKKEHWADLVKHYTVHCNDGVLEKEG